MTARHSIIHSVNLLFLSLTLTLPTRTTAASPAICSSQLPTAIEAILNRPTFARSRWGVFIQTLANPAQQKGQQTLFSRESQRYFIPASNTKLLTTAAALHKLGSQFRIRTSVYGVRLQTGWRLHVVGRGDPSLTDAQLKSLAQQLSHQGIQRVEQLVLDDSYYQGDRVNRDWAVGDIQQGYGAPVNSLILNQNAIALTLIPQMQGQPLQVQWNNTIDAKNWRVDNTSMTVAANAPEFISVDRDDSQPILSVKGQLRVGAAPEQVAVAIAKPAQNFLQHFQQALAREKISVAQTTLVERPSPITGTEVAFVESPPLAALIREANQESNNLYAEAILRLLGTASQSRDSSITTGLTTLGETLKTLKVESTGFSLVDGSGLARLNLISPEALVQTLQSMASSPTAGIYRASLPVAGMSGTLRNRFQGTPAQGIVQAKTGTLTGISALSGYLTPPNYVPIVFSIMVNQSTDSASVQRAAIDEIVLLLTSLRSCSR